MNRMRLVSRVLSMIVLSLAGVGLVACSDTSSAELGNDANETRRSGVPVDVHAVALRDVEDTRQWTGVVEDISELPVVAPHAGVIQGLALRPGDRVQRGQLVARIRDRSLEQRYPIVEERVNAARADVERWNRLEREGAAGPLESREAEELLRSARIELAEMQARRQELRIVAPSDGRVVSVHALDGGAVERGAPIWSHAPVDERAIRLTVPGEDAARLQERERLTVRTTVAGDGLDVREVRVGNTPARGFVEVHVFVEGMDSELAMLRIEHRERREVPTVPWTALGSDDGQTWVARIDEHQDGWIVERVSVRLGEVFSDAVEIAEGLNVGDRVVALTPRRVADGGQVVFDEVEE